MFGRFDGRKLISPASRQIVSFAAILFFLHFAWEMLQTPFFAGMSERAHWPATIRCLQATLGDVVMGTFAFMCAAVCADTRFWFQKPDRLAIIVYLGVGLLLTTALEWSAINWSARWAYAPSMPVLPGLGVGLVPLAQWLVVPLAGLAVLRRLFSGAERP